LARNVATIWIILRKYSMGRRRGERLRGQKNGSAAEVFSWRLENRVYV